MASEKQLARASSLGPSAQRPIPSRTSSIRRLDCSAILDSAIVDTSGTPPPIPRRSPRSIAASQKVRANDGRQLDLLLRNTIPTDTQLSKVLQTNDSSPAKATRRSSSYPAANRNSMSSVMVQRWGGLTRTVSDWDGLRRVSEYLLSTKS